MPTENQFPTPNVISLPMRIINRIKAEATLAPGIWEAIEVAVKKAEKPVEQQSDADTFPPCDYCGTVPNYHPWHGSGMLKGVENRHIHACDGCRSKLPAHTEQHQGEPVAWLNTATGAITTHPVQVMDWDDESEPVQALYTHADAGEVERLRALVKSYEEIAESHADACAEALTRLAERDVLLRDCRWRIVNKDTSTADYQRLDKPVVERIDALSASAESEAGS